MYTKQETIEMIRKEIEKEKIAESIARSLRDFETANYIKHYIIVLHDKMDSLTIEIRNDSF